MAELARNFSLCPIYGEICNFFLHLQAVYSTVPDSTVQRVTAFVHCTFIEFIDIPRSSKTDNCNKSHER